MAFTEGSENGALNGNTPVTIVSAPGAATRRILRCINIANRDTAAVVLTMTLVDGVSSRLLISSMTLDVGDTLIYNEVVVLDTTAKSITAVLAGAPATTNPDYMSSWGDAS